MLPFTLTGSGKIYQGDAREILKTLPNESIDCVVTSPPYWQKRDYEVEGQLGLEEDFNDYIMRLILVFDEVYRILKPTGTVWVNIGDTYYGGGNNRGNTKPISKIQASNKGATGQVQPKWNFKRYKRKSLCMIPSRFAIEMIDRGWILRNEIVWQKPNPMPESVKDRFTSSHEMIYFFTKSPKYYFNQILVPMKTNGKGGLSNKQNSKYKNYYSPINAKVNPSGKNMRDVFTITKKAFKGAHFAVFPPEIPEIAIKAGCPENGIVLDPFIGSGTTAVVAEKLGRKWIGIDLNKEYCEMTERRVKNVPV